MAFPPVKLAEPSIAFAVEAKSRNDEDRMGNALHKLLEEDLSLRFYRDPQTKEFLVAGTGQQHVEIAVSRLKKRYGVDVTLKAPKIPYRETIRGTADVQGRHKKQTGGHGQFGDCWIRMEPLPRGAQVRVRQRHLRRLDSQKLYSGGGKRNHRNGRTRLSRRLSDGGFQGDGLRRLLSRRRFLGTGVQAGGAQSVPERHADRQTDAARAGHECRSSGAGGISRAT